MAVARILAAGWLAAVLISGTSSASNYALPPLASTCSPPKRIGLVEIRGGTASPVRPIAVLER